MLTLRPGIFHPMDGCWLGIMPLKWRTRLNRVSLAGAVCPRVFRLQTWSWHSVSTHDPSRSLNQRNWSRKHVQHTIPAQLLTSVSMKSQIQTRLVNVVTSVATAGNSSNKATNIKRSNAPRKGMGLLGNDSLVRGSSHSTLSQVGLPILFPLGHLHLFKRSQQNSHKSCIVASYLTQWLLHGALLYQTLPYQSLPYQSF